MQDAYRNSSADLISVINYYWEKFLFLLPNILLTILIFVVAVWLAGKIKNWLEGRLTTKSHDKITGRYIAMVTRWIVIFIGLLLGLQALGLSGVAGGLLASAGLSAFVIGFAFKDIAENFLAGLILAFDRPFEITDTIEVEDTIGKVQNLHLRSTHLLTFDSRDVYIPNAKILSSKVTNLTQNGRIRMDFVVGIDYNDDAQAAIDLIERTALGVPGVLQEDPPYAAVDLLDVSTLNIKVFFWAETKDYKKNVVLLKGRIMQAVSKALLENGFGLPANIQELKLYDYQKDLPIRMVEKSAQE
ncbi:mechanosensitive ion channel family protein [Pontibacter sp. JH31]|uniref:Mechanosensitive ion channel family protein n=1 Tax=Pontibacter aquaedesilientis TaxID=2766980 RepID=A0ABR7XBU1_9BACT|nr:mechanosensitive ion channel family protein [Pontibacter aquaedesilientis]MBD1395760.1 mechanosensitive ion channel family protein [Pontibacter aquaedesilientis]